LNQWNLLQIH